MGLRDFLFGSDKPDDLEQAFATGEIDAETYQEGLQAQAKAEAKAQAEKQKALEEAQQSRSLQANAKPSTHAESSGSANATYFQSQDLGPSELDEIRDMRESGGIISEWLHARALLEFGTGAEFESEEDRLAEWLNDNLHNLDNLLISLGEDAIYYPRSYTEIVETRGGDFSHIECIEPWTMTPETDEHGEITQFTQVINNKEVGTYDPEEIGYFILNKSSGRDKLGISQVYRAKDEIETYLDNKRSVANAIELAGFPHVHWQVGAEDSMIINDNELRRVRNIVGNMDSDSQIVTGTDVEHEVMQPTTFDFTDILTHDSRQVATALGVPAEIATVISEGLGSGEQSQFRRRWFESQTKADRRMISGQFVEQVAKPILIKYGGFPERLVSESNIHIDFEPIFEEDNTSDMLNQIGEDLTVNERRGAYGKEPVDDDEIGESYDTARGETTEDTQPQGGLFGSEGDTDFRGLADIPEKYTDGTGLSEDDFVPNASISDVVEPTLEFIDEHGLPNPDNQSEGAARVNQLKRHIDDNDPMEPEFWREIANFHKRHRAQGNHNCDESSLPAEATEIDNSQFDKCYFDAGWFSNRTWGGDPAYEQAQRIVDALEENDIDLSRPHPTHPFSLARGGSGNWKPENAEPWERAMLEMWDHQLATDESDRALFGFSSSDTPEFVFDRIREAINSGVLFSQIDAIDSGQRMELKTLMMDSLTDEGWTITELAEEIQDFADISSDRAELIARTETAGILNTAREKGYEAQGQLDDEFYWTGATQAEQPERTTDACDWLISQTNPFHGGDPVSLERLKELIEEAPTHDPEMQDDLARPEEYIVHPNERKTWARAP